MESICAILSDVRKTNTLIFLVLFCQFRFILSPKRYCSPLLLLFFFVLLVYSFSEKFFNAFTYTKYNNREDILQNCDQSLVAMTLDSNCCEDFLLFRHSQDVKNSFCLCFSIFLLCKQLLLNFFRSFHLLNPKYSHKHFQDRAPF